MVGSATLEKLGAWLMDPHVILQFLVSVLLGSWEILQEINPLNQRMVAGLCLLVRRPFIKVLVALHLWK